MKKLLTIIAILFVAMSYGQIASGSTTVNIIISEAFSIEVNHATVNLTVDEASEFVTGVTESLTNHIKIISTVPYEVSVAVNQDFTNGSESIPAEQVKVELLDNTTLINSVPLSTSASNVIPLSSSTITRNINVNYVLLGGDELLVSPGIYSAIATYTLIPQ